jgi:signal peptidase I
MRQSAENWLEMADRVHKFRRDLLTDGQNQLLLAAAGDVRQRLKERAGLDRLKAAIETLEKVLRETGGAIYPVSSMIENVEFFLVAAIVILGLRAYFVQPFKIPTNSMWPTYYGMTAEYFKPGEEPGLLRRVARLATLGAANHTVTAPADGELLLPVFSNGHPAYTEKAGRSMFVFPTMVREYLFAVGGEYARVAVPAEFTPEYEHVVADAFKGNAPSLEAALQVAAAKAKSVERSTLVVREGARPVEATVYWIPLGKTVQRGEKFLSFDILTGDLLFVDRFTYNFFAPKVGSGFVFKTGNIEELKADEGDKYFIKRLVGVPGDTLEIRRPAPAVTDGIAATIGTRDGQLFRNGQPISGSDAFGQNARKEGLYPGYTADGRLDFGQVLTVPQNFYFAMGDNSPRSKDSRYWGFVPDKDVVGRPLFIYYPLTKRWGPTK